MSLHIFLLMLLIVSTLTGLVTEGVKKLLQEWSITYYANTLAGIVAVVVSAAVGAGYMVMVEAAFNAKMAVYLIALIFMSWLGAMVGYDKVRQAIAQICDSSKK